MPSFSFLKHASTESKSQAPDESGTHLHDATDEKVHRRHSKRNFLRTILKRYSNSSESQADQRHTDNRKTTNISMASANPQDKPASPKADPNKPLPPPPAPDHEHEPTSRAPSKLERIISPINTPGLHKLFSGAPQFFDRSEGHYTGAPHPSVAFPWDIKLDIRDLSDHIQIKDEAWGSVTAWPHITRDVSNNLQAVKTHHEKQKAHFWPRCRERPNMLSMQGIERGSMGFQAALEMGVADALRQEEDNYYPSDSGADPVSELRKKFLHSKDGLRPMSESTVIECLTKVNMAYHGAPEEHGRSTVELYTELFTQILFPPSRVTDSDDPYSLQVQIEVLLRVLATPGIWIDFSLVEWRIRLGQILWGPPYEPDSGDDVAINNETVYEPGAQKFWLLLQILLSCELSIRLDAVCWNIDHGLNTVKPGEIDRFEKDATTSVKWSLILAHYWLENIIIEERKPETTSEKKFGWLSSLTSASPVDEEVDIINSFQFRGRYQSRQLSGLLRFARILQWPNVEDLATKISSNSLIVSDSSQSTPASGTPLSVATQQSTSYFVNANIRPGIRRGMSRLQYRSTIINHPGWLSNSYLSGLILPGEGLSHLLISTLLENDNLAIAKLGGYCNLYGGFVYFDKSFWSKACIVGRVLATGEGACECMGWISSDVTPRGVGEVWVDIEIDTNKTDKDNITEIPRILNKSAIEHDGHITAGFAPHSTLPGDFIVPYDKPSQQPFIHFESLDLFTTVDSIHSTPSGQTPTPVTEGTRSPGIRTYSAMMRFSVEIAGEEIKEMNFALENDVFFVTAHPCLPSHDMEPLNSPTVPTFHGQDRPGPAGSATEHPLHKFFTFTQLPLSAVLSSATSLSLSSLLSPAQSPNSDPDPVQSKTVDTNTIPKVLVIDCTNSFSDEIRGAASIQPPRGTHRNHFGSDLEMLVRALCAERGWNALISRQGRGCLACAVREAGALGWQVVIRLA